MKNTILLFACAVLLAVSSCSKSDDDAASITSSSEPSHAKIVLDINDEMMLNSITDASNPADAPEVVWSYEPADYSHIATIAETWTSILVKIISGAIYGDTITAIASHADTQKELFRYTIEVGVTTGYIIKTVSGVKTWEIYDELGLRAFAQAVKSDIDLNAILMSDIRLKNPAVEGTGNWEPMCSIEDNYQYLGVFDGNNKTIYNLQIIEDRNGAGFFSRIGSTSQDSSATSNACVKNLKISAPKIRATSQCGAIVGKAFNAKFENCAVVDGGSIICTEHSVGGLIGIGIGSSITDCHNTANINCTSPEESISTPYSIGGIVGYGDYCEISSCYNTGDVISEYGTHIGGISGTYHYRDISGCYNLGKIHGASNIAGICNSAKDIDSCYNKGEVISKNNASGIADYATSITNCYNTGNISGTYDIGGIARSAGTIANCYNTGTISGLGSESTQIGGIVANSASKILGCYNIGASVSGKLCVGGIAGGSVRRSNSYCYITGCYNTAEVRGEDGSRFIGGIIGAVFNADITSCYNAAKVSSGANNLYVGSLVGYYEGIAKANNAYWVQHSDNTQYTAQIPIVPFPNGTPPIENEVEKLSLSEINSSEYVEKLNKRLYDNRSSNNGISYSNGALNYGFVLGAQYPEIAIDLPYTVQ